MRRSRATATLCVLVGLTGMADQAAAAPDHVAVPDNALPKIAHHTGPYTVGGLPGRGRLDRSAYAANDHVLPWNATGYGRLPSANPAVGRLRFQLPNGTHATCTATVVSSALVLTAAHCVRNGASGAWNHYFEFRPGLYGHSTPFGVFRSTKSYVSRAWADPASPSFYPRDFAFVRLRPDSAGREVGARTGAYAIGINSPVYAPVLHVGYASEGGFDGCDSVTCYPWFCNTQIQDLQKYVAPSDTGYSVGFSCLTTGGSSGGPEFQNVDGAYDITSVLS